MKIAVLAGGVGTERQISLQSGECVARALGQANFETILADIKPDDLSILDDATVDVFFIAQHGEFGEDGQLQQILEDRGLCYTGSGPKASRIAIDKIAAKIRFADAGVRTPAAIKVTDQITARQIAESVSTDKCVVKPVTHGSSIGVEIVAGPEAALAAGKRCLAEYGDAMIERFVPGREITVGILDGKALPVIEIRPKAEFYDYQAKYLDDNTEYLFDTVDNESLIETLGNDALVCFNVLGCRHFGRVDFILTEDGTAYAFEINTIPGMTTHSCLPKAAAKVGIQMPELCTGIAEAAMNTHKNNKTVHKISTTSGKKKEKEILSQEIV